MSKVRKSQSARHILLRLAKMPTMQFSGSNCPENPGNQRNSKFYGIYSYKTTYAIYIAVLVLSTLTTVVFFVKHIVSRKNKSERKTETSKLT